MVSAPHRSLEQFPIQADCAAQAFPVSRIITTKPIALTVPAPHGFAAWSKANTIFVSQQHLHQYAADAAWKEDHRRLDNGRLAYRKLGLAFAHPQAAI